jgi:hypothetical protein
MKSEISGMNQVFVSLCQQYGSIGCGVSIVENFDFPYQILKYFSEQLKNMF